MEGVPGPRRAPRYFQRGPGPAASLPVLSFWVMRWKAPCTWSYRWFIWRSFSSDSFCSAWDIWCVQLRLKSSPSITKMWQKVEATTVQGCKASVKSA